MKQLLLFPLLTFFVLSCDNDGKQAKVDSLKMDSVLKSLTANTKIDTTVATTDTAKAGGLPVMMEGDLVFQNLEDAQSLAFGKATHSGYNNIGIVFQRKRDHSYIVLNVKDSVHITPLTDWISQGKDHRFALLRLRNANALLNERSTGKIRSIAKTLMGKKMDRYFSWTNDELYPSEFVWKIYKNGASIELSTPGKLRDLDLTGPLIKQEMKGKYPALPLDEQVVTPDDLYNSSQLEKIYER